MVSRRPPQVCLRDFPVWSYQHWGATGLHAFSTEIGMRALHLRTLRGGLRAQDLGGREMPRERGFESFDWELLFVDLHVGGLSSMQCVRLAGR